MKKYIIALALAALTILGGVSAEAARGVIALIVDDKVAIEGPYGDYTYGILYSFPYINEGDVVYGDMNSFGMKDFYDATTDQEFQLYVDGYYEDADSTIEYMRE